MSFFLSFMTALFHALDPTSLQQNVAFYELYADKEEGKAALERAAALIKTTPKELHSLRDVINSFGKMPELTEENMVAIERLGSHFTNRKLAGYKAESEEEMLALSAEQIDLGKAVILSQTNDLEKARQYSCMLDLMALQIEATLPKEATDREKIVAMNSFVFETMRFRFPPQSVYAKNIDQYTFLAQVMDEHLGVCLGVSTLVLALGQRLDLPLEAMTPPGHIYVRYRDESGTVNIETTMRGVDVPEEQYLSIHTHKLLPRTIKEVVGMAHVNEASCLLHQSEWSKAKAAYEKALCYMEKDPLVLELLGLCMLFVGEKEGEGFLRQAVAVTPSHTTLRHKMAEDYLQKRADVAGLKAVMMQVDESRESIEKKRDALIEVVKRTPQFRDALHQLAISWLMLGRAKEAIAPFRKLAALDSEDPLPFYYLTVLHGQRKDFKNAWRYFLQTEEILRGYNFMPKALQDLRYQLTICCPEKHYS